MDVRLIPAGPDGSIAAPHPGSRRVATGVPARGGGLGVIIGARRHGVARVPARPGGQGAGVAPGPADGPPRRSAIIGVPAGAGGFGVIIGVGAGPARALVRVTPASGDGGVVAARPGGCVIPGRGAGLGVIIGAGLTVRGRGIARVPGGPACRGVLAGPGQPGTPASTGPVSLIRFPGAALVVSPRRPGLLLLRGGPRGAGPDIRNRQLRGRLVPGRGRLPGPVVPGSAGTGWLTVAFLVELTEITDEGQRDAPWRGGGLFLFVGFLRRDVCFLPGPGRALLPGPGRAFGPGPGRARVVGRGVTPGEQWAQRPCLCPLARR